MIFICKIFVDIIDEIIKSISSDIVGRKRLCNLFFFNSIVRLKKFLLFYVVLESGISL